MIYLTVGIDFDKSDLNNIQNSIVYILKIGYTDNIENKRRESTYITSGIIPGFLLVREGTLMDERALQVYFRRYKYHKLSEWFHWSQEIIDNFMVPYEEVYQNIWNSRVDIFGESLPKKETIDHKILERLYSENYDNSNIIDWEELDYKWDSYIKKIYPLDETQDKSNDFLIEFSKRTYDFREAYKYLCESRLPQEILNYVSKKISQEYINYYYVIGPDKSKSLGYQRSNLVKEYNNYRRSGDIKSVIISEFQVSQRYTLKEIKERLGEIYQKLNISKTPKALDLENYFEIKKTKVTTVSGVRENGLEIIQIK